MTYTGLARIVDGKPCGKCSGIRRYASSGTCVTCDRIRKRNLTPEQKAAAKKRQLKWKKDNRERHLLHRRTSRYKIYGLNEDQFNAKLTAQQGECPGCGTPLFANKATNIDHDHLTGVVRGLLCMNCNVALGLVKDSTETLLRLGIYLEKYRG